MTRIIDVEYIAGYSLALVFNNDENYVVDLTELVHKSAYSELQSLECFKQFGLVRGTLEWINGLDVAPEYLYDLCQRQLKEKAVSQ